MQHRAENQLLSAGGDNGLLSQLDRQNMAADQHCGPIALIQISHNATIIQTIRKVVWLGAISDQLSWSVEDTVLS